MQAVGRIAYLASDTLVVVQSASVDPSSSPFTASFHDITLSSHHKPSIISVPAGGDPTSSILFSDHPGLPFASLIAVSSQACIHRLLANILELSELPITLHLAVQNDLSDVLLLRSAVSVFLISYNAQQAHDNALLASKLSRDSSKAVVHVFYIHDDTDHVNSVSSETIRSFLSSSFTNGLQNGYTNGHANGHVNGHANGHINGHNKIDSLKLNHHELLADDSDAISDLASLYDRAALMTRSLVGRPVDKYSYRGSLDSQTVIVCTGNLKPTPVEGVLFVSMSLSKPFTSRDLEGMVSTSTSKIIVLEQAPHWPLTWRPLYLDVLTLLESCKLDPQPTLQSAVLAKPDGVTAADIAEFVAQATQNEELCLGLSKSFSKMLPVIPHIPKHESSYLDLLSQIFGDKLDLCNAPSLVATQGKFATAPEFALGRIRSQIEQRAALVDAVKDLLRIPETGSHLHSLLGQWISKRDDYVHSRSLGDEIILLLESSPPPHSAVQRILLLRDQLPALSKWIVGSDAWSYDLGASGLHHVIASGLDINILILDTTPYSSRNTIDQNRRKRDIGLYAMNYGTVYVASIALYSSYSQAVQALSEADRFHGPSVILAYLPYTEETTPALDILKETKLAVDTGYWPLYRWNPQKEIDGKEPFSLDSDSVKNDLQQFLDRQNHLSQLTRSKPAIATELVSSLGQTVKEIRRKKAQQAYEELLTGLDLPPVLVLYASDGGAAEKIAKKLVNRGKARGLVISVNTMDSMSLDDLSKEEYVVFITSTAGQGEPPQNGRRFFKALNAAASANELRFSKLHFAVFGMGDSHYWPRPEDAQYYNKPGRDLDVRLNKLGGERLIELGLGDDQDADGPQTGYKLWEPQLWKALNVDSVEVTEAEPDPITNEHIKAASRHLRGTIAEGLQDTSTGALAASDTQLTKFHGIYQQDDRDIRDEREAQGVEPAYSFMIRVRMPGGVCNPAQWLQMDQIADEHGNGTFKITTRQTFQFHGVIKKHLKSAIQDINKVLLDTLAACGDVNRNVIICSIPTMSKLHKQVYEYAKSVSEHLIPRTTAYHEIWLDRKLVAGEAVKDFEPLYGEFYLPRKFKIAVAVPPNNDVDVFANDLGFIAIADEHGDLAGFNVTVGGGMGVTHGNKKTYPRAADVIGFCTIEQGKSVAEKVMLVQRDNGNRADRKNARLKYTIDRMGLDVFKAEVEKLLGYSLLPPRSYAFDRNIDDFGWAKGEDGKHHFTMFIENGRIQDEAGQEFKTGLREIAKVHKGTFRLTANQHLLVSDIDTEDLPVIKTLLARYKLDNLSHSGLRLSSSACVAFPTCGLAMAESERYLPLLIDKVEKICEENGLRNDSIVMRMTGCPNGCARPYLAEVAFVGKAPGSYLMLLGGGYYGQRLNKIYRENVTEPEILAILGPMIKHYALERQEGERFGDFTIRAGYISPTTSGKEWYEHMGGEGIYREVAVS